MKDNIVVSPLNYTGGKKKLIKEFKELFPKQISTFVDLFCGGCTVGTNITSQKTVFNDSIPELISLYSVFKTTDTNTIVNHIENRIKEYSLSTENKDGYNALRNTYNRDKNPLDLFVLICYGFNHQIRFNSKGEFNIPFGKNRSQFNSTIKTNLTCFLDYIHNNYVEFTNLDFRLFDTSALDENSFVYCDPPYLVSTATYNDSWGETDEKDLLSFLDKLNERGIKFALSNVLSNKGQENTILKEWINNRGYKVLHLDKTYSNSNYHRKNKDTKSDEVLIYNF